MSKPIMSRASPSRANATAAATPPAGPDSAVPAASRVASATDATPPCDRMTSNSPSYPASRQRDWQPAEIVLDHRPDRGIGDGGGESLELLDLRQHVEGGGHVGAGQPRRDRLGRRLLVCRIAPGVQEADRDAPGTSASRSKSDGSVQRGRIERHLHRPVGAHALRHRQAQAARHQRAGGAMRRL